jgi:FMN phosphatase YigB (HAD superfamily)
MNTFLFDLDGTLLPMNQDDFIDSYFKGVARKMIPYGFDPKALIGMVWEGTKAMIGNDGSVLNYNRFWDKAVSIFGEKMLDLEDVFIDYYKNEFQNVKETTKPNPLAKECIKHLKEKGYRLILATNPLFPRIATHSRIKWAGLEAEDFDLITTYENSSFCKPNIKYFEEILKNTGLSSKQCMMVGNDVNDDMIVETIGMDTFLVTDCLINENGDNINRYKKGLFSEFNDYIKSLSAIR